MSRQARPEGPRPRSAQRRRDPAPRRPDRGSDQYDVKIQSLGLPGRAERLELLERAPDRSRLVWAGGADGRLTGVVAIDAARRLGAYRLALADPPTLEEARATAAADPGALGVPVATG